MIIGGNGPPPKAIVSRTKAGSARNVGARDELAWTGGWPPPDPRARSLAAFDCAQAALSSPKGGDPNAPLRSRGARQMARRPGPYVWRSHAASCAKALPRCATASFRSPRTSPSVQPYGG